jgi:hypothetical protein
VNRDLYLLRRSRRLGSIVGVRRRTGQRRRAISDVATKGEAGSSGRSGEQGKVASRECERDSGGIKTYIFRRAIREASFLIFFNFKLMTYLGEILKMLLEMILWSIND